MVSSLLSIAYLMPVVARGFFYPSEEKGGEAPFLCVVPPVLTAIGCIVLFFLADDIYQFLTGMLP